MMGTVFKNVLAVLAGFLIGSVVNMAIVIVGPMVIPPPDGVDMSDMERFAENLKLLRPANFVAPWLAHAAGTLVGAFVAAKLAATNKMMMAGVIGSVFFLGGVTMVVSYGGPTWFAIADLVGAYFPMAYLGGRLACQANLKVAADNVGEEGTGEQSG